MEKCISPEQAASYLLDEMEAEERRNAERHFSTCPKCGMAIRNTITLISSTVVIVIKVQDTAARADMN